MNLLIHSLSAIEHLLLHKPKRIMRLSISGTLAAGPRVAKVKSLAQSQGIRVDREAPRKGGEPITASLLPFEYTELPDILEKTSQKKHSLLLALDHLQDPQNFGALCRTAEALGIDGIFIPKDRSVVVTAGVYHASVGAVDTIPICRVTNLAESFKKLKEADYWIVGAATGEGSSPPWKVPDFEKKVLVLGAEYEGVGDRIAKICDWQVHLPLKGQIESLNVSVAGALLMYELSRKPSK